MVDADALGGGAVIGDRVGLARLEIVAGDDGDRVAGLVHRLRRAGGGDDDIGGRFLRERGGGERSRGQEEQSIRGVHAGLPRCDRRAPLRADETSLARGKSPSRSEEHTSELQSLMRSSNSVFCLKTTKKKTIQ